MRQAARKQLGVYLLAGGTNKPYRCKVAMTVRVTSPRETVAVVYRTTPPLPDSHQPSATAATTESDNKAPTIQIRRECGTDGSGGSADGFGTSTTGAGRAQNSLGVAAANLRERPR